MILGRNGIQCIYYRYNLAILIGGLHLVTTNAITYCRRCFLWSFHSKNVAASPLGPLGWKPAKVPYLNVQLLFCSDIKCVQSRIIPNKISLISFKARSASCSSLRVPGHSHRFITRLTLAQMLKSVPLSVFMLLLRSLTGCVHLSCELRLISWYTTM